MNKLIRYSLCAIFFTGCLLATGCVRRTVSEGSVYKSSTSTRNPNRNAPVVKEQTYWIWQGGFWSRDKQ